jgi:hypothetical protein
MLAAAILRSHDTPFIHDDYLQEGKAGMSLLSTHITSLPSSPIFTYSKASHMAEEADHQNSSLDCSTRSISLLNKLHSIVPLTDLLVCY